MLKGCCAANLRFVLMRQLSVEPHRSRLPNVLTK